MIVPVTDNESQDEIKMCSLQFHVEASLSDRTRGHVEANGRIVAIERYEV